MIRHFLAKKKVWLLIAVIGIAIAIAAFSLLPLQDWLTHIKQWLVSLGFWAKPAFILIYIITTVVGLPAAVLFLAAGTLFGFF